MNLTHKTKFRIALSLFIFGLVMSGITAFPLQYELKILAQALNIPEGVNPKTLSGLSYWIATVKEGLENTNQNYPWLAYGTDWLAFGHLVIALFFIGPWIKPQENAWVLWCGIIACIGVIPLALICGEIRQIPFYWRLIDCSFGVFGIIPLFYCISLVKKMKT